MSLLRVKLLVNKEYVLPNLKCYLITCTYRLKCSHLCFCVFPGFQRSQRGTRTTRVKGWLMAIKMHAQRYIQYSEMGNYRTNACSLNHAETSWALFNKCCHVILGRRWETGCYWTRGSTWERRE